MRLMSSLLALVVVAGLAGCAARPVVTARAVGGADFRRYRTYAIKPGNVAYPGAQAAERAAIELRIQDAVAVELEARGLTPRPDGPDVIVTYTAGAQREDLGRDGRTPAGVELRGRAGGGCDEPGALAAGGWRDGAVDLQTRRRYREGNLVIDLLAGKTRKLVWRATANVEIASDRGARMIGPVVARAFKRYPVKRVTAAAGVTTRRGTSVKSEE